MDCLLDSPEFHFIASALRFFSSFAFLSRWLNCPCLDRELGEEEAMAHAISTFRQICSSCFFSFDTISLSLNHREKERKRSTCIKWAAAFFALFAAAWTEHERQKAHFSYIRGSYQISPNLNVAWSIFFSLCEKGNLRKENACVQHGHMRTVNNSILGNEPIGPIPVTCNTVYQIKSNSNLIEFCMKWYVPRDRFKK